MPKPRFFRRWFRRATISSGILVIAIPLATLREVDRTPWDQSESASEALEIAATIHGHLASAKPAPLEAGWAAVRLPTAIGQPLAGYGARGNDVATALGDPLYARALYLRSGGTEVVFLAADILLVSALLAEATVELCRREGIGEDSIYYTATHTHCGPGGWAPGIIGQLVCGDFDPNNVSEIAGAFTEAILAARKSASPAEWTWLETVAPAHVRNRTQKDGPTDPTLEALAVRKTNDPNKPTALLAFYGAHATCFGHRRLAFSPDYPGALIAELESGEAVEFAAFAAGCVGSQSPAGADGDSATRAALIGKSLANLLSKELETAHWHLSVALATSRKTIPVLPLQVRVEPTTRLAPYLAETVHSQSAPLHFVRLDDHYLAGLPAEFSAMLSAPLRAESKSEGKALTITPFNGDYIGYVLPSALYDSGAYETTVNFQGPGGGEFFSELIRAGTGIQVPHRDQK